MNYPQHFMINNGLFRVKKQSVHGNVHRYLSQKVRNEKKTGEIVGHIKILS